jgi:hypothetical protein|tara:strand:+ start:662 stop:1018 length:357 start_codon:yes stop_codon:yes gene_type:complete
MLQDEVIMHWIDEYGVATKFTFMVYGQLKEEEVDLLIKGLVLQLEGKYTTKNMAVFFDEINEEQAVAWNTYRGTSLAFIFAGDILKYEPLVQAIIEDGLEFLKYKAKYISGDRSFSNV